jgi:hypothetical protein
MMLCISSFGTLFAPHSEIPGKIEAFDQIVFPGPCMSTRMMPTPGFVEMEWLIASALDGDVKNCGFQRILFPTRVG